MNNGFFDWLQYLLSFALVIGLLLGCLWALRKLQSGAGGARGRSAARLKVVETLSLGPRQKIALVQLDGQHVLLGITAQSICALNVPPPRVGMHMDTRA